MRANYILAVYGGALRPNWLPFETAEAALSYMGDEGDLDGEEYELYQLVKLPLKTEKYEKTETRTRYTL